MNIQPAFLNGAGYTEWSPTLLGLNNVVITPGAGGVTSNVINVAGFSQFMFCMACSQNLQQFNLIVHMIDTENWQTLYVANNALGDITLADSGRFITGVTNSISFGRGTNSSYDAEGEASANLIFKRITFALSEAAPGAGSPTTMTCKLLAQG